MAIRLEHHDEYMHDPAEESSFNESMYVNLYDPAHQVGAFFRIGNRPNEGRGEVTVCCYLPDGRVGFMFQRPKVTSNEAFDSGGMRFEVLEPFERLAASYHGEVVLLDDPRQMADPKRAFTNNPLVSAQADLTFEGVSPMFGGENDEPHELPGEEFARGHYEQLMHASGSIRIGGDEFSVNGYGLRDHSWGARTWQAPWYYRWLTGNSGPDFGFMASRVARRDGAGIRGGFVWEAGTLHLCDRLVLTTEWDGEGEGSYHARISASLGSGNREWQITGRVLRLIPLRNRRESPAGELLVTRISEGLTEWTVGDGRVGFGLSEYLDQIVEGQPVGLAE